VGQDALVLECVVNVSEGRREDRLGVIATAAGADLLDVHRDGDHHRAVLTVVGTEAPRRVATAAVAELDLRAHDGVHPRLGVVDVVPFVPLEPATMADAVAARDAFAGWAGSELGVPCFLYGEERSLPQVRKEAWRTLAPDTGPREPHPTAGAMCVGARPPLVAYNVWLVEPDLALARRIASTVRGPHLRSLGLAVGRRVQVSMNLIAPGMLGPAAAYDLVAAQAPVAGAELVGLVPQDVLLAIAPERWDELDLAPDRTIEARLAQRSVGARADGPPAGPPPA
jgi:glutamate formiminotransferase / 5-formyltetrahydrofolate cyclo-ligase